MSRSHFPLAAKPGVSGHSRTAIGRWLRRHRRMAPEIGRRCPDSRKRRLQQPCPTPSPAPPTSSRSATTRPETHTLSILVDNEPGVLARIAGLFSGRGYNIDSLTVSETEHEKHLSRFTIVTTGTPMVLEQIKNQLERLVTVHRVVDLTVARRAAGARAGADQGGGQGREAHRGAAPGRDLPRQRDRRLHRALRVRDHGPHLQDRAVHLHHDASSAWSRSRAPASPPSPAGQGDVGSAACAADPDLQWALLAFVVVTLFTPGPNNTMLMASGLNFGFRRGLPHLWGVALGFARDGAGGRRSGSAPSSRPIRRSTRCSSMRARPICSISPGRSPPRAPSSEGGRRARPADHLPAGSGLPVAQSEGLGDGGRRRLHLRRRRRVPYNVLLIAFLFGSLGILSSATWLGFGTGLRAAAQEPARRARRQHRHGAAAGRLALADPR